MSDAKIIEDTDASNTVSSADNFIPEVQNYSDMYAFGSPMPGRQYQNSSAYRYGTVNGQEKDDEIAGAGNITTAEFWEYDTRTARRWNIDPVVKPWMSSYHAFSNKPILSIDPNGANDGDYYDKDGKHVGNDGIKDDKVYHVEGNDKFDIKDFQKGGKYHNKQSDYGKDNGEGYDVKEWNYAIKDSKLNEYFPTLLAHEGGYVNNPKDPGGATNKGVTLKAFQKYAEDLGVEGSVDNLKRLTKEQAALIYEKGYWNPSKATTINDKQIGWLYFDTYLNGGGTDVLTKTISNFDTGKLSGIKALNSLLPAWQPENIFYLYKCERKCRYDAIIEKNAKLETFKTGWYNRVDRFIYKK